MQILQEKLIWLLGCASLLVTLYRDDFARRIAGSQVSIKLRSGLILIAAGAIVGIISRLGLLGRWLLNSGTSFYLESLFGYVIGWSLVVWGVLEWSRDYKDRNFEPLSKSRLRLFSEKAAPIITSEHSTTSLLDGVSRYLLMALNSQAITLHICDDKGNLNLVFQSGLTSQAEGILCHPQQESLTYTSLLNKKIMASDSSLDLHSNASIEGKGCQLISGLSQPIISGDHDFGVLTVFSSRQREYGSDEIEILGMVVSALSATMRAEKIEHEFLVETGFRDVIGLITKPFNKTKTSLSYLLESAKLAGAQIPFDELNLYLAGNGPVTKSEYAIPNSGIINIHEGYFNNANFPFLFNDDKKSATGIYQSKERKAIIIGIDLGNGKRAWLEFRAENLDIPYLSDLLRIWANFIAQKIGQEKLGTAQDQAAQWLGAIRYYQERALESTNVAGLLQEMASLVTDLKIATYCQITLADPQKVNMRTAALSQIRPLDWHDTRDEIPTSEIKLHHQVLLGRKQFEFDQASVTKCIPAHEAEITLPDGIQHGLIIPITIGDEAVGLLTLGEFRARDRECLSGSAELFASNLAALISMVLSWHKEKRVTQDIKEGKKKLTIIQKEPQKEPQTAQSELTPTLRSRLNGPLAGIMASCEYLQNGDKGLDGEIGRFINVIERNAAKIHEITSGTLKP